MQGRLSPPKGGRIQSFPVETWRDELSLAREADLACIEWVYEEETEPANPLRSEAGAAEIRQASDSAGVAVCSVCADYYMSVRLVEPDGCPNDAAMQHLRELLDRAALLGAHYVVLPFVDDSSLTSPKEIDGLLRVVEAIAPAAEGAGVDLHLETDLDPAALAQVYERASCPCLRVNYDTGNSASLGYDPTEELTRTGQWLGSVHVKDRVLGGGTVPLGTGSADLDTCFRLIHGTGFTGPYILQTAREEDSREVELAVRNRRFVEGHLAAAAKGV